MGEILKKPFKISPDDAITHVISEMSRKKRHEAFVFKKGFLGIVKLEDIMKRGVTHPEKTKASYYLRKIHPLSPDMPVEDLINYIMVSQFREIPVKAAKEGGGIYSVSKPKLLRFVDKNLFRDKKAEDVMYFPHVAAEKDDIETVLSMMKELGVSRIPVLDGNNKFIGIADDLALAEPLIDRERSKRGRRFGEKITIGNVAVDAFVRKDLIKVKPEDSLENMVKKISDKDSCTVIVEKEGKFNGMITAKEIFKLIGKGMRNIPVRVSGFDDEDEFIKTKIDKMVGNLLDKVSRIIPVRYLAIHADTLRKGGRRAMYSVKGRLVTEKWNFYVDGSEWDPTKAVGILLDKLERNLKKKVEKKRGY